MAGRPRGVVELTDDEHACLTRWARRGKSSQALVLRSKIVLLCADGLVNTHVAQRLGVSRDMVGKWRSRSSRVGWRASLTSLGPVRLVGSATTGSRR